jgi:lactonase
MLGYDRRTLLRNVGTGALAAGLGRVFPPLAAQETKPKLPDPIPPSEAGLRQIKAEPWLQIDRGNVFLKGMAFDRRGHLTVIAAYASGPDTSLAARLDRSILSIAPDQTVTTLFKHHGARLCDHAIHKDGRIFVACLTGELFVINADGSSLKQIPVGWSDKPRALSDLTFDTGGNLYVTDFIGTPGNPLGGVYRYSPDLATAELFGPRLVTPNGVAFTKGEKAMWTSCSLDKKVVKFDLSAAPKIVASYGLSGPGGDGIRVDAKDNMYLSLNFEGRFLIFNAAAEPIATVLLPGHDRGELLSTTNLVFKPGTDEVFAVASGELGGTWIYKFRGLADGLPLYSHQ